MAHFLAECYRSEGITAQIIDLRGLPLPFCDGEAAYDHRSVLILSEKISAARVIIVATPIYNFDASAVLKNLIELTGDLLGRKSRRILVRGRRFNELHVGHEPCKQSHARLSLFDHSADCLRDESGFRRRRTEFVRSTRADPGIGGGIHQDS